MDHFHHPWEDYISKFKARFRQEVTIIAAEWQSEQKLALKIRLLSLPYIRSEEF